MTKHPKSTPLYSPRTTSQLSTLPCPSPQFQNAILAAQTSACATPDDDEPHAHSSSMQAQIVTLFLFCAESAKTLQFINVCLTVMLTMRLRFCILVSIRFCLCSATPWTSKSLGCGFVYWFQFGSGFCSANPLDLVCSGLHSAAHAPAAHSPASPSNGPCIDCNAAFLQHKAAHSPARARITTK